MANNLLFSTPPTPQLRLSGIQVPLGNLELTRDIKESFILPEPVSSSHGGKRPYIKVNVLFVDGHVRLRYYETDWSTEVLVFPFPVD